MLQQKPNDSKCECNNIQVIDDELLNHMAVKTMLKNFDLSFYFAYDGQKGFDVIKNNMNNCQYCSYFKAIVMDFNMPIMGGIESAAKILELLKERKEQIDDCTDKHDILIVGFSAYTDEVTVNEALDAGMIRVQSKPTSRDIMVSNFKELGLI